MKLKGKKVLIVDDEPDLREVIAIRLEMDGCAATLAENGQLALEALKKEAFDVLISDIRMPGMSGIELLDAVHHNHPKVAVLLISGFSDVNSDDILARGASALLVKPFNLDDVLQAISDALSHS